MTEERLKEIKDSIDFQLMIGTIKGHTLDVIKEELELYNEVVRLRKIIDKAKEHINKHKKTITQQRADFYNRDELRNRKLKVGTFMWYVDELEDILRGDKK